MRVGFIGLGNMGFRMARNLAKNGVPLTVFDADSRKVELFKASVIGSIENSPTLAELSARCRTVITVLPDSTCVRSAYSERDGICEGLQPESVCIDCSTIEQSASISVAELVTNKMCSYLDAPVSGGVGGAENATLTFMVGGNLAAYERSVELFNHMGKKSVYCGKVGNGQAAKICNNMLLAIQMIGLCEAMNLGEKMGLDAAVLTSIINTSSGRCWASDTYNPVPGIMKDVPASRSYEGGFRVELMAKDLGLAQTASTEVKAPTPMGSLAHQLYRLIAKSPELREKDFSVLYQYLKDS